MIELGSSSAALLTVSFAPITSTKSVSEKSSLISSISSTSSYGTPASASSTFNCPGIRPATGWIPNRTFLPRAFSMLTISAIGYCALATHNP
uniref:Putative secreted peptide n=1 Tax=Anopheles braziliensis TaxID=58242 RepID=A0A2M3ZUJ7_9DIPT